LRICLVAVLAVLALGLAACGGKHGSGIASANGSKAKPSASAKPADPVEKMRKYAACMRAHGVDMPDPQTNDGSDGGVTIQGSVGPGTGPDSSTFKAAEEACRSLAPNSGDIPKPNATQLEQMRKFAACMRAHGVDMPDPDPDTGGVMVQSSAGTGNLNPDNPTFKAAQEACRNLMPSGGGAGTITGGGQ
jgi:hypothetical protein